MLSDPRRPCRAIRAPPPGRRWPRTNCGDVVGWHVMLSRKRQESVEFLPGLDNTTGGGQGHGHIRIAPGPGALRLGNPRALRRSVAGPAVRARAHCANARSSGSISIARLASSRLPRTAPRARATRRGWPPPAPRVARAGVRSPSRPAPRRIGRRSHAAARADSEPWHSWGRGRSRCRYPSSAPDQSNSYRHLRCPSVACASPRSGSSARARVAASRARA